MTVAVPDNMSPWLLLVFSLAKKEASLRVTVWRKLQRFGAVPLGNSGYLIPHTMENRERFEWLATTIRSEQGEASVVEVMSIDNCSAPQLQKRFTEARDCDYQALLRDVRKVSANPSQNARATRMRQRFQEIVSIDFFGSPIRDKVEGALNALEKPKLNHEDSDKGKISPAAYRNRLWVTRPRPGIDRVTSAWLVRRLIDPKARFVFATEDKKPANAVPFDMYEGGFGHCGEDCTFETLLKVFRIRDTRARVMGQIVHDADLLDDKFSRKEGFGIDEVMKGWARQGLRDKELLERGIQLAEGLYDSLR
jgi:hypothetical protein